MRYRPAGSVTRFAGILVTFHLVAISWVFFRSPDFASAGLFFRGMLDTGSLTIITSKFVAVKCLLLAGLFVIVEKFSTPGAFFLLRSKKVLLPAIALYGLLFFLLGNFSESPFIYFQF